MSFTPNYSLTISSKKLKLFALLFFIVSFSNLTISQNNIFNTSDVGLLVNEISNVTQTEINNNTNSELKEYLDYTTEENICVDDNLNVFSSLSHGVQGTFVPIAGNNKELKDFFRALRGSKTNKIRIAHYGDSILLGDVITENLRQNLQRKYGGDGIGYLSIVPDDLRMKRSIRQTVSGTWKQGSMTTGNRSHLPIGMSGMTAQATSNSSVKFEATKFMRTSRSFNTVRIFYSNASYSSSIKYSFGNAKAVSKKLQPGADVKELVLTAPKLETSFDLKCGGAAGTYFYGVSLETGNGIYVDNFSFKGDSGVSLVDIKKNTIKKFDKYLNYKLVIINFGINATTLPVSSFIWYKNKMKKVINHFKSALPGASILVVSVGDKSIKTHSKFVTDPKVVSLLKLQEKLAKETNVAFWNLFKAMGGNNSMSKWVNSGPPLALMDYVHLTSLGGKVVADLLTKALLQEYNKM